MKPVCTLSDLQVLPLLSAREQAALLACAQDVAALLPAAATQVRQALDDCGQRSLNLGGGGFVHNPKDLEHCLVLGGRAGDDMLGHPGQR
jgi:hypothetical protein